MSHNHICKKATIPVVFLPVIVALIIHMLSLSSLLLLRNPPNTFAFISIPPMSLSSLNRSNSKAFCHILPCVAPVCEGMHYHKTGVPWHTNSIFIIYIKPPKMLDFTVFSALTTIPQYFYDSIFVHIFRIFWNNFA